ncbi:MAG: amidohydrolase family protein [Alphaproteobacteria bacterium]
MTIDMHTHFVPEQMADALRQRTELPWIEAMPDGYERIHLPIGVLDFDDAYSDMEARINFMDARGVDRQLLSFPGLFGLDSLPAADCGPLLTLFNDEVSALSEQHSDRFTGLAALPFADMDAAVAELRRGCAELGLAGAILPNNAFLTIAEAEKLRPVFEAGNEIGVHFFIHPGRRPDEVPPAGTANTDNPFADLAFARQALNVQANVAHATATLLFSDFLDDYSNVSVHIANLGGTLPMVIERMEQVVETRGIDVARPMTRTKRLHVDCSSLGARALELAVSIFGADRIVMGTDCPIFSTDWTLAAIRDANIPDAARQAILHGNAERLLSN